MKKEKINLLLLDFCSIKNWTVDAILGLQKKYKIVHTREGQKRGHEIYCFPKFANRKKQFALVEDSKTRSAKRNLEKGLGAEDKPFIVLPSEKEHEHLRRHLKRSQEIYANFLIRCSAGELDIGFINKLFSEFNGFEFKFSRSTKEWEPELYLDPGYFKSFESYINWEILQIFSNQKAGDIFPYIKKCLGCDHFYKAKILRRDQKYCPSCSKKSGMRTKHPDQWKDYIRAYKKKKRTQIKKAERESEIKRIMEAGDFSRREAEDIWEADQQG